MSFAPKNVYNLIGCGELKSPAYVFDQEIFSRRSFAVKEAFGENIDICFSIKANPFLLKILPECFSKVEVCSPGELEICKKLNVEPEMIVFSGVNKSSEEVTRAVDYGVGVLTAESLKHVKDIQSVAQEKGTILPVLLRLSDDSQFGITEETLVQIIKERSTYPELDFQGLHFFTGTGKKKSKEIQKEMNRLMSLVARLESEAEYKPSKIEYGAGLGVDYFAKSDEDATQTEIALLQEVASILVAFNEDISSRIPNFKLTVEMGRFFSAPCGFYITGINDTKTNEDINYMIVDGGLHQLKYDGQLQGMKIPVITLSGAEKTNPSITPWTVCGSLCTTADVLTRNVELESPAIGDYLVFHRTGAYSVSEGMAMFLSRDLPAVYINTEKDELLLLRDRVETACFNTPL